jgi:NAD(P)-dependent dehydrogenase (short-subunit alcohol dehydrogenase family)
MCDPAAIADLKKILSGTYGASKIAQEQIADVFRLELMPFKVKSLMVVTGAIPTNGQTYFGDWKLPANSRYKSAEEKMKTVVQATDGMPRTPREEYANQVVDHILGGTTDKVWLGERAEMVKNSPVEGEGALIRVRKIPGSLIRSFTNIQFRIKW